MKDSPKGQSTISSYFCQSSPPSKHAPRRAEKRPAGAVFVDLTSDGADVQDARPTKKKAKIVQKGLVREEEQHPFIPDLSNPLHEHSSPEQISIPSSRPRTPVGLVEKYGFSRTRDARDPLETSEEKRMKQSRQEIFKRKLLTDTNVSSKLDQGTHAEKQSETASYDAMDIDAFENTREEAGDESSLEGSIRETRKEKEKLRERMPTSRTRVSAVEEIGPSGQTYTPLEKQVGIIGQMETAALKKVSENRNNPFDRALTNMYTAATYIDEVDSEDDPSLINPPVFVCITEGLLGGMGADERVSISLVAITPSTGDVIWDEFEDGFMRSELETRMAHIKPSEIYLSNLKLSKVTEKVLHYLTKETLSNESARDRIRLERYKEELNYTEAFQKLKIFYAQKNTKKASENFKSGKLLAAISDLPRNVSIVLAHSVDYLSSFGLADILTQTQFFAKFTQRQHMLLNANTLSNLEIYRNQTDFTVKGSLMWVLNKTRTTFGARLLRSWIGRPLVNVSALKERVNAIEAILSAQTVNIRERLMRLRELLKTLREVDLARGLSRIQYSKCTPRELAKLLRAFIRIADTFDLFETPEDVGLTSPVLNDIIFALPKLKDSVKKIVSCINLKEAEDDKRDRLWVDPGKYPEVDDTKMAIMAIESELSDHLKTIRKILKKPAAQYITINQDESARRYRTPECKKKLQERAQYQEKLEVEANKVYLTFLVEIMDEHYVTLRNAVNNLAIVDCLFSMAEVASQDGYVKPIFVEGDVLEITDGRHPMIEVLRKDPFLPNSLCLGDTDTKAKIITGPNMGGKSSAVRMVALIALMAQIGSYVPASSVRMSPLDAILTRMGASDNLARGRSTFMVEMSETSNILHSATPNSLVILDELGRGSSTFDGMAIAGASLEYLVETRKSKTLFITHYPVIAVATERKFPDKISNLHMGFTEEVTIEGKRAITFLYRLAKGISSRSYGIECARLAGIPEQLLETASKQAETMEGMVQSRSQISRYGFFRILIQNC
ncbi:hypothetical protein EW145_g2862 [Phellinidium pouzarii]|uniref:MutS protein homolog 3 n=1 Tax=Phellinidium pouzarii TaxID=167371 RepID=A0A4S4LB75_9AGAM|nr:hypothetical protein EW145_g2862 [Phellinidium pouzarii]